MLTDILQPLLKLEPITPRDGVITFGFKGGSNQISAKTQDYVRYVFKNTIEPFLKVRFVETTGDADINFQLHDDPEYYAYADKNHDVFLRRSDDNASPENGFQAGLGSHGFETLIHETLHALGLGHPGNYNGDEGGPGPFLPYDADNTTNSVMSYNSAGEKALTPMPYDIAALQSIYGASNLNSGNTHYRFSSVYSFSANDQQWGYLEQPTKLTLSDSEGLDTLDLSNLEYNSSGYFLDAQAGGVVTTQAAYNASSYKPKDYSNPNTSEQKTTAFGTRISLDSQIERIFGSDSNDVIIAGSQTQELSGLGGNDTLRGNSQGDRIWGDLGNDTIYGNDGDDYLVGGSGGETETDASGNDQLFGGAGSDQLRGEGGDDFIAGEQDDDILFGGSGRDGLSGSSSFVSDERDQLFGGGDQDFFMLGSESGTFYQGDGFAIIKDWQAGLDRIFLGSKGNHSTQSTQLSGSSALDTGIYYNNDLIAIIEDSTDFDASRGDFIFA